jgi:hypothetical protein
MCSPFKALQETQVTSVMVSVRAQLKPLVFSAFNCEACQHRAKEDHTSKQDQLFNYLHNRVEIRPLHRRLPLSLM